MPPTAVVCGTHIERLALAKYGKHAPDWGGNRRLLMREHRILVSKWSFWALAKGEPAHDACSKAPSTAIEVKDEKEGLMNC